MISSNPVTILNEEIKPQSGKIIAVNTRYIAYTVKGKLILLINIRC
jgi:hypothetical protein